jgi:Sigma-70 region 2
MLIYDVSMAMSNLFIGGFNEQMNQYINNKTLYGRMIHYKNDVKEAREAKRELPKIPDYIGECVFLIANNLVKHPWYVGYSPQYKQEMISDAILDCVAAVDNFNPEKSTNPFGYFTMIAWNAFRRRLQKEKKQQYIKLKNYESSFVLNHDNLDYWDQAQHKFNDQNSESIRSYEEKYLSKNAAEKKKAKTKKGLDKFV